MGGSIGKVARSTSRMNSAWRTSPSACMLNSFVGPHAQVQPHDQHLDVRQPGIHVEVPPILPRSVPPATPRLRSVRLLGKVLRGALLFSLHQDLRAACFKISKVYLQASLSVTLHLWGILCRLDGFVIYMPCIKLSTVITISTYRTVSLPQIQRCVVCH